MKGTMPTFFQVQQYAHLPCFVESAPHKQPGTTPNAHTVWRPPPRPEACDNRSFRFTTLDGFARNTFTPKRRNVVHRVSAAKWKQQRHGPLLRLSFMPFGVTNSFFRRAQHYSAEPVGRVKTAECRSFFRPNVHFEHVAHQK